MSKKLSKAKSKAKLNLGAILAAVGGLILFISFFVPFLGSNGDSAVNGIDLVAILFGGSETIEGMIKATWLALVTANVTGAGTMLELAVFISFILSFAIIAISILSIFINVPFGKLILRLLSAVTVVLALTAIICAGVIQAENTVDLLGEKVILASMHAGPFLLAIGSGICAAGASMYKKR